MNSVKMPKPRHEGGDAPLLPASAQAGLMTAVVLLAYMGQMLLNPIIAPLSREMGLQEWHIGATLS